MSSPSSQTARRILVSDEQVAPQPRDEHGSSDVELAPEDQVVGQEIRAAEHSQGAQVPQEGRLVMVPSPTDKVERTELN